MTTITDTTAILFDITAAIDGWVKQGGDPALTVVDIETIARDNDCTCDDVVNIAREAGVDIE